MYSGGIVQGGEFAVSDDPAAPGDEDPSCTKGYDLEVEKTVLTGGQYMSLYSPEHNTYPDSITAGEIELGDRRVYRVEVTNGGPNPNAPYSDL
jgi:hypothetical protein